jgi:hypothetical protein
MEYGVNVIMFYMVFLEKVRIMLLNSSTRMKEMEELIIKASSSSSSSSSLSREKVSYILLSSKKKEYENGMEKKRINEKSISKIIDSYLLKGKIVFVANRLSNRGLSYVSSDYKNSINYQYINYKKGQNGQNVLQKLRIFGNSNNNEKKILFLPEECKERMEKIIKKMEIKKMKEVLLYP